jgi:integrase/recombinase XerD
VDLESGVIHVAHGKGDKARTVPVLGDLAIEALRDLHQMLPEARFVFPSLRRGDHPNDWPITGDTVWRIVKETSEHSGVDFKPHDARRTVITGILDNGGTVKEAQAVAGHAAASTTMVYAQAADAKALRDKLKTGY